MNRNGFVFGDVIFSIFLIGLTIILLLPILNYSWRINYNIKLKKEMNYLCEYVFERLNSKDEYTIDLLNNLGSQTEFTDLNSKYNKKYKCTVISTKDEEYLWNLKIIVEPKINKGGPEYVELFGTIPK